MKLLIVQLAALGYNALRRHFGEGQLCGLEPRPAGGLFPALTCPVQATLRTGLLPSAHGIVGNGFFFREQWKPLFWEQSARLIEAPFAWEKYRSRGGTVAQMFVQQSLGPGSDIVISPAPIHRHHGGMILDCYSSPRGLYPSLKKEFGEFPLSAYWGPLASAASTRWIARAVCSVLRKQSPGLLYAYLPHLDYEFQRSGPDGPRSAAAVKELLSRLSEIIECARASGYRCLVFSDYAVTPAADVSYPNRALAESGLLVTRVARSMEYADLYASRAFAVADHQIAHVYVFDAGAFEETRSLLAGMPGVERVLTGDEKAAFGIAHRRSGDIVLIARPGCWFDYRWWKKDKEAPDYASHVDIHNKPGYDPCELFFGWPPPSICQKPLRVKGTHGRVDSAEPVWFATDALLPGAPKDLAGLASAVAEIIK